jgi:hypothetical protein
MFGLLAGIAGIIVIIFSWDFLGYQFGKAFLYEGTHIAVESCINENKSNLISDELIRNLCAREESEEVSEIPLDGRASPKEGTYAPEFSGTITNNFDKTIITGFVIGVSHYIVDSEQLLEGQDREDLKIPPMEENRYSIEDIWLEPGQTYSFEFFERDMTVIPDMSIYENEAVDWNWFVRKATGVQVQTN